MPETTPPTHMTYAAAGVDIDAADRMLAEVKQAVHATHNEAVLKTLSDFGGLYALGRDYTDPVLVSGTDGVGTKLKLAFALDKHDTIGQDLVAMCADDIVVQGARPLFFLDYFATGKLKPETGAAVIRGIAAACATVGCALIGGESAELPGFYAEGEYDLAGFAVGVVERAEIIDGSQVREGDHIIGLASSGLHSNGYSLARKVLLEAAALPLDQRVAELGRTLGEELLEPTRLYAHHLSAMFAAGLKPHGLSHITGGGWTGNINRIIPEGLCAVCEMSAIPVLPIFSLIQKLGNVTEDEMYRAFNMGIGMVLVAPEELAESCLSFLSDRDVPAYRMGVVERGDTKVRLA
ncbi:MAG: phosphoribosylformylglycinamidine cyclo-ligase [Armatimonadota bacterium]